MRRSNYSPEGYVVLQPDILVKPAPALAGGLYECNPDQIRFDTLIYQDVRLGVSFGGFERQRWVELEDHGFILPSAKKPIYPPKQYFCFPKYFKNILKIVFVFTPSPRRPSTNRRMVGGGGGGRFVVIRRDFNGLDKARSSSDSLLAEIVQ